MRKVETVITRPVQQRKAPPINFRRKLPGFRTGTQGRFQAPPPQIPLDPTLPAQGRKR